MKGDNLRVRYVVIALIGLMLITTVSASGMRISVGGFAGLNLPVAMDDVKMGPMYGFKARFAVLPAVGIEPNFTIRNYGDSEAEVFGDILDRDGGRISAFGVDVLYGQIEGDPGLSIYGLFGLGSAKWTRDGIPDVSEIDVRFGMGLEYLLAKSVTLEFRGTIQVIPHDDGSYKNGGVTVGLNYFFGEKGGIRGE